MFIFQFVGIPPSFQSCFIISTNFTNYPFLTAVSPYNHIFIRIPSYPAALFFLISCTACIISSIFSSLYSSSFSFSMSSCSFFLLLTFSTFILEPSNISIKCSQLSLLISFGNHSLSPLFLFILYRVSHNSRPKF